MNWKLKHLVICWNIKEVVPSSTTTIRQPLDNDPSQYPNLSRLIFLQTYGFINDKKEHWKWGKNITWIWSLSLFELF